MDKFYTRRTRIFLRSKDFTNWAYTVIQSNAYQFQVFRGIISSAVNLMSKTCSCGEFQDLKLPYQHAIAAISYSCYSISAYVSDLYLKETYKNTYKR
jgi:hypothetical protein